MSRGRSTVDPKGVSIRVRINENMRSKLEKKSAETGKSISQTVRDLITQHLN